MFCQCSMHVLSLFNNETVRRIGKYEITEKGRFVHHSQTLNLWEALYIYGPTKDIMK